MGEWWVYPNGINMLEGLDFWSTIPDFGLIPGTTTPDPNVCNCTPPEPGHWEPDPDNPARLPRDVIIDFLRRIPEARSSFCRLFRLMSTEEQERLTWIAMMAKLFKRDPKLWDDLFQKGQNTVGIYTTGPKGGIGYRRP